MKTLVMSCSTILVAMAVQGCTVNISSVDPVGHAHQLAGIESEKHSETTPVVFEARNSSAANSMKVAKNTMMRRSSNSGVKNSELNARAPTIAPNPIAAPKVDSSVDARFVIDTLKAIAIGCMQFKC